MKSIEEMKGIGTQFTETGFEKINVPYQVKPKNTDDLLYNCSKLLTP